MNPLILPIGVAIARAFGWEGVTNPYLALSLLGLCLCFSGGALFLSIKCYLDVGKI